jgi:hypothetical protein
VHMPVTMLFHLATNSSAVSAVQTRPQHAQWLWHLRNPQGHNSHA